MLRPFIITGILVILTTNAYSQSTISLSGKVTDEQKKSLANVSISLLLSKDSSFKKAALTDSTGVFEMHSIMPGKYLLSFSAIGYRLYKSSELDIIDSETYHLPVVILNRETFKMNDVTVVARKQMIEVKADKTIFNIENSINATGSNALELLQKSPGVTVDNNENISMKGKVGVKIYVDGKMLQLDAKELASYLKSVNSNDLEAIEMISNPSAKYDASGNAGIINLRLKKSKRYGLNGSANATYIQGFTPKGNGGFSLNYRDKKINLFSNIGGDIGLREKSFDLYRLQLDTIYDQQSKIYYNHQSINFKAGADFFIDKRNTIGIMGNGNINDNNWSSYGKTLITYQPTNLYTKTLEAQNVIPGNKKIADFNFNYRFADTAGKNVDLDLDYGLFSGNGKSYQPNYYTYSNTLLNDTVVSRNNTPVNIDIYTAKLDIEHKFLKGKLGYGVKYSFIKTDNHFDFYDVNGGIDRKNLSKSNSFIYTENVNAGYINFNRSFGKQWNIQTGLRFEQTNSEGKLTRADGIVQPDNDIKREYLDLFPSAAITWQVNNVNILNLSYSKRIDRPGYEDLNPFEHKLDELTYKKGNAFLRPQYTNSITLTHTFNGSFNTSIGYSQVADYSTDATDTIKNATYVQPKNLAEEQLLQFNIGLSTPLKKWWTGYLNFWYNYQMYDGVIGGKKVTVSIPLYGAFIQQSFLLGKDYTAEISGEYNGPGLWGATTRSKAQGGIDIGLQKLIYQKKFSIKVSVADVLCTRIPLMISSDFGGTSIKGNSTWESRTFRLSIGYRFGSKQVKESRNRKTGMESEAGRLK